jgi:hypothetical protein
VDQNAQVNVGANVDGQPAQSTQNQTTTQPSSDKTFTQDEVNQIVTKRLSQFEKKFANVNVDEYQELKSLKEQQEQEAALKRQEFDKVLGQVKSASEQKIAALTKELETIKIDGALIAEASSRKAVAPDKVAALLRSQLKLTQDGAVEVLDSNGQVRYDAEKAKPLGISDLVDEFLNSNPYFVSAAPAGSGAKPGIGQEVNMSTINVSELDMRKPEHREIYRKMRQGK